MFVFIVCLYAKRSSQARSTFASGRAFDPVAKKKAKQVGLVKLFVLNLIGAQKRWSCAVVSIQGAERTFDLENNLVTGSILIG